MNHPLTRLLVLLLAPLAALQGESGGNRGQGTSYLQLSLLSNSRSPKAVFTGFTKKRGQDFLRRGWGWLNSVDAPSETRRREECDLPCLEPWQWPIGHFPQGRRLRSV